MVLFLSFVYIITTLLIWTGFSCEAEKWKCLSSVLIHASAFLPSATVVDENILNVQITLLLDSVEH